MDNMFNYHSCMAFKKQIKMQHHYLFASEPPSVPRVRALRDNQPVSEVNDGETLDVECTVEAVYPVDVLQFQLMSGDNEVTGRRSGISTVTNSDGAVSATKIFSVEFRKPYSSTDAGLMCKVYHPRDDNQSEKLAVTVACE